MTTKHSSTPFGSAHSARSPAHGTHQQNTGGENAHAQTCNPLWLGGRDDEWDEVLHLGNLITFRAKAFVPEYQEEQKGFYYLKQGKARVVHHNDNGKKIPLYHLCEGALLHDVFEDNVHTQHRVQAITPLKTYFFSQAVLHTEEFSSGHPKLMLRIIEAQSLKSMHCMRRILNVAGSNAFANACKFMVELSKSSGNALEVPLGVTHEEIASLLCVRRSWLGKILRRLKDEGAISHCTKRRLVISNIDMLAAYALGTTD